MFLQKYLEVGGKHALPAMVSYLIREVLSHYAQDNRYSGDEGKAEKLLMINEEPHDGEVGGNDENDGQVN